MRCIVCGRTTEADDPADPVVELQRKRVPVTAHAHRGCLEERARMLAPGSDPLLARGIERLGEHLGVPVWDDGERRYLLDGLQHEGPDLADLDLEDEGDDDRGPPGPRG